MKTAELSGAALDWAVAKCEGLDEETLDPITFIETAYPSGGYAYSTNWSQGGAIIERDWLNICKHESGEYWQASEEKWMLTDGYPFVGPTPLIAAMRCYVASKLGDDVELPEELLSCTHE